MNNGRERKDRSLATLLLGQQAVRVPDPLAPVEIGVDEWRHHVRASFKAALFGFSIVKWSECQSAAGAGSGCH
jgi:hypothetical protein